MLVIGVGLAFLGYSVGLWAYAGIRGYNVTLPQIFSTKGPPGAAAPGSGSELSTQGSLPPGFSAGTGQPTTPNLGGVPQGRTATNKPL